MRIVTAASLAEVADATSSWNQYTCYRGQSNASWHLVPSLYRALIGAVPGIRHSDTLWIANCERDLYREFEQKGRALFNFRDKWEIFFLAQHYGVPTRLLDWTKNVAVALFFAVSTSDTSDAAVWCLGLNEYPFPESLGRRHRAGGHRLDNIKQYCASMAPSFMQNVTRQNNETVSYPEGTLVAIEPPAIDPRIEYQESIFTFYLSFEDDDLHWDYSVHLADIERKIGRHLMTKIEIPYIAKAEIRKQLEQQMRISVFRLFPDLAGLGKWLSDENRAQFDRELARRPKPATMVS
jgi:hypothetical protein